MGKFSFFGSFMISLLVVIVIFFILYFFLPTESERFFGLSYQSSKDLEQLKKVVTSILSQAGVAQISIEEYVARFDSPNLHAQLKGEDEITAILLSLSGGIDFSNFRNRSLEELLREGLTNQSALTTKQKNSLIRLGLDYLLESH
ncbi:MAG: hypothetical protein WCY52_02190 [Sphaerochaetaceae bacterium]